MFPSALRGPKKTIGLEGDLAMRSLWPTIVVQSLLISALTSSSASNLGSSVSGLSGRTGRERFPVQGSANAERNAGADEGANGSGATGSRLAER